MTWFFIIVQGFLCIAMFGSGGLKVIPGETVPKKNFTNMRLPGWWLMPIGVIEVLIGVGLLIGFFVPSFTRLC
jgi:DoxX-like family